MKNNYENLLERIFFIIIIGMWLILANYYLAKPFYRQDEIILFSALVNITDIAHIQIIKRVYFIISIVACFIIANDIYMTTVKRIVDKFIYIKNINDEESVLMTTDIVMPKFPYNSKKMEIVIGLKHNPRNLELVRNPEYLVIPQKGMYQNVKITGLIGTGKTSSAIYPILKQIIFANSLEDDKKAGMLAIDVKGNFYRQVVKYAKEAGREDDIVLISMDSLHKYNPMHKPNLEPLELAGRARTVMDLFSSGAKKDKFWDSKAKDMMTEAIRLIRKYNNDYVTMAEIHKIISNDEYLMGKIEEVEQRLEEDASTDFDFLAIKNYFEGEYSGKAETTVATIKLCVTEMTAFFATSKKIYDSFCPTQKEEYLFTGFSECINDGKIVILAMNAAEYPEVSKTIAAYLKLDFQAEIRQRTSNDNLNKTRPMFFICDEYQEFVTSNDAEFYGVSRESNCCSIVATQSDTSLLKTLGSKEALDVLDQNLVNKIWLRNTDELTIKKAQIATGKEDKVKFSKNITENINDPKKSSIHGKLIADKGSFSETISISTTKDFIFDEKAFSRELEQFKAICFLSDGNKMYEPTFIHLLPYFDELIEDISLSDEDKKIVLKKKKSAKKEKEVIKLDIEEIKRSKSKKKKTKQIKDTDISCIRLDEIEEIMKNEEK